MRKYSEAAHEKRKERRAALVERKAEIDEQIARIDDELELDELLAKAAKWDELQAAGKSESRPEAPEALPPSPAFG